MKKVLWLFGFFLILAPEAPEAADFDFYGIKFGMAKEAVEKVFKVGVTKPGGYEAENPGHYMKKLYLSFDHKNRLFYIEAYYPWEDIEHNYALALALKERFEDPVKKSYKDIEIKTDSYKEASGQETIDYIVMKLTSRPLRREYIDYLRLDILKKMR